MIRRSINRKWAKKLMKTKNFVVLTDTEAVIYLVAIDKYNFGDILTVSAQAASLENFRKRLDKLIAKHKVIQKEMTDANIIVGDDIQKKAPTKTRHIKVEG